MVQGREAAALSLWAGMLKHAGADDGCDQKGPRGRMFYDMLDAFPKAIGVSFNDIARLAAEANDLDKMTVAFHLQAILNGQDDDDGLCHDGFLSDLKARAFMRHFNRHRLAAMDDSAFFNVFMLCLSGPPTMTVQDARAYFYEAMPIPQALKAYHYDAWNRLRNNLSSRGNIDALAVIIQGLKTYNGFDNTRKLKWVEHVSRMIAKAYNIPNPSTSLSSFCGQSIATCAILDKNGIQSAVRYKFDAFKNPQHLLSAIFHEVAGHAVENALARRSNPAIWNRLDPSIRKHYSMLKPDTDLHRAAFMLAFNASGNHEHGHYASSSKNYARYAAQLNEKVAAWVAEEGSGIFLSGLEPLLQSYAPRSLPSNESRFCNFSGKSSVLSMTP